MALCSATCLGLPEWTECCGQNSRFASILTDEEAEKLSAGYTPKNTEKANKWAIETFEEWRKWRNEHRHQDPAPSSTALLLSGDAHFLNKWLSRYAVETRGENLFTTCMHKLYIIELPSGLEYMNNFLSVHGIYNPPVARETRVKWGI